MRPLYYLKTIFFISCLFFTSCSTSNKESKKQIQVKQTIEETAHEEIDSVSSIDVTILDTSEQNIISKPVKSKLLGLWSNADFFEKLQNSNSITKSFMTENQCYDGLYFVDTTLLYANFPEAMEEHNLQRKSDSLIYNWYARSNIDSWKVVVLEYTDSTMLAEVTFSGNKFHKKFIKTCQPVENGYPIGLCYQYLYWKWFAGKYELMNKDSLEWTFSKEGDFYGLGESNRYGFFRSEKNDILFLKNSEKGIFQEFIVEFKDSLFHLMEVNYEVDENGEKMEKLNNSYLLRKMN